jgi:FKBP-type peptidyl-prolyl cis-trans isomerase FklB
MSKIDNSKINFEQKKQDLNSKAVKTVKSEAGAESFQGILSAKMKDSKKGMAELGAQYMLENKAKDGVQTTSSGLQYKVQTSGSGATPKINSIVEVHYEGSLIDGKVFDSSEGGKPINFPVNGVIPGWTEALMLMKEGDTWDLTIPSKLAYGSKGAGADIPGDATLNFKVQLISVK